MFRRRVNRWKRSFVVPISNAESTERAEALSLFFTVEQEVPMTILRLASAAVIAAAGLGLAGAAQAAPAANLAEPQTAQRDNVSAATPVHYYGYYGYYPGYYYRPYNYYPRYYYPRYNYSPYYYGYPYYYGPSFNFGIRIR